MTDLAVSQNNLHPPILPYRDAYLKVSDLHELYYEECGNPSGLPIVFLHGGPGAGCSAYHRQFFDPKIWRVILFDQRGAGRSRPHAELRENTTWDLVGDIEKLRTHLRIDQWFVFGGSWGSTLALAYAETHVARCRGLILRGIFLVRSREISWYYQDGCKRFFPDLWKSFAEQIPAQERGDMVKAYYRRLTSEDARIRIPAAKAWSVWEGSTVTLLPSPATISSHNEDEFAEAFARIECHYFINSGFLEVDDQLLRDAKVLKNIPVAIVQGRYDMACPMESAWDLYQELDHAEWHVIEGAGHSANEDGIAAALVEICNRWGKTYGS